jgi:hypothetical protein
MAQKFEAAFTSIQNKAKRAFAGTEWSITFGPEGITINDGFDLIVEEADPDEAAEEFETAVEKE